MLRPSPAEIAYGQPVRALVDTCVMLDALGVHPSADQFRACAIFTYLSSQGQLLHSDETLAEWDYIAGREETVRRLTARHGINGPQQAFGYLATLKEGMEKVSPTEFVTMCRDDADNMWLEAALAGGAHAIITRDSDLLVLGHIKNCRIFTPPDFLAKVVGCQPAFLAGIPVRGTAPA